MNALKQKIFRFLRWSERYTKTDMVYLGKGGFWLGITQTVGTISAFVLAYLFANYVDQQVYGVYKYILSTAGFLGAFSLTGMNTSVVRAVAQGYDGAFKHSIPIQIKWSIPYFLFSITIAGYYFFQENNSLALAFIIVSIFGPISSIANTFSSFLQGKKDFKTVTLYSTISTCVYFVSTIIIIFTYPRAVWLISTYFIVNALINSFYCFITIRKNPQKNEQLRKEDVSYAKYQSIINVMGSVAQQVDNIVVYHLLGPVHLAVLSFATLIPNKIKTIFGSVATLALPKLSEHGGGSWVSIKRKTIQLIFLTVIIMISYIITVPLLFKFLFPEYISSVVYSQVFTFSLLLLPSYLLIPTILANKEKRGLYALSIVLPLIKIVTSIVLIFLYGLMGAIVAKILHDFLYVITSLFFARKATINNN